MTDELEHRNDCECASYPGEHGNKIIRYDPLCLLKTEILAIIRQEMKR